MSENLVSIVIPTYNCAPLLRRAIQSVIDQTHTNWEVIVIDNYSSDNTDEVIAKFNEPRITHLKVHNHGVIAHSRNHGLRLAKGKWLAFLDADDWWMPEKLALSVQVLQSGSDIVYHDLVRAGPKRPLISKKIILSRDVKPPVYQNLVECGNALLNSSVVIRRNILQKVGELSENRNLIGGEDLEYWLRIAKVTDNFRRLPEALGYYWIGNANTFSPERAINCLTELRANHFDRTYDQMSPAWVAFALAKANYVLGRHEEALIEVRKIKIKKQNFNFKIKTTILKYLIYINKYLKINLRSLFY